MNRKRLFFFLINISVFIAVALGGLYLVNLVGEKDFSFNLTPSLFIVAFVAQVGAITFSAWAWLILLKKYQGGISFHDSVVQTGVIVTAKYIPGKLWGLFIRSALLHQQGFTKTAIAEASIIEQVAVVHSGFVVTFLFMVAQRSDWMIIPALVLAMVSVFSIKTIYRLARDLMTVVLNRIRKKPVHYPNRLDLDIRRYVECFCAEVINWLLLGVVVLSLVLSYSDYVPLEQYTYIIAAVPVSVLIGFFALFAPGGLGVREGVMTVMLASLVGMKVAAIAALSFRVWSSIVDMLMGGYSLFTLVRQKRIEGLSRRLVE